MHGVGGEDGLVQSYLDKINVKYIGSNSESSKLSFNKVATKEKWVRKNIPTPNYSIISEITDNFLKEIQKSEKIIVKPTSSGSSVGIKILRVDHLDISGIENLTESIKQQYDSFAPNDYFIEEFIHGNEYTAPIVKDEVLPIIKIDTSREFYNSCSLICCTV